MGTVDDDAGPVPGCEDATSLANLAQLMPRTAELVEAAPSTHDASRPTHSQGASGTEEHSESDGHGVTDGSDEEDTVHGGNGTLFEEEDERRLNWGPMMFRRRKGPGSGSATG